MLQALPRNSGLRIRHVPPKSQTRLWLNSASTARGSGRVIRVGHLLLVVCSTTLHPGMGHCANRAMLTALRKQCNGYGHLAGWVVETGLEGAAAFGDMARPCGVSLSFATPCHQGEGGLVAGSRMGLGSVGM
jgi:hypothetical protein